VAIDKTRHEVELLREYRTRLIADVVTGKLDVREAVASLPDEPEEPEAIGETLAEDEEAADYEIEAVAEEAEA
jgi:type I restriction enzyme S subunit